MANPKEEELEQKAKSGKSDKGSAERNRLDKTKPDAKFEKGSSERREAAVEDDGDAKERKPKASNRKVPYPVSPANVPEGLTDYADSYTKQQNLLLAGLFLFLVFYIGAVLLFALIGVWCAWSLSHIPPLKIVGLIFCTIFFLFLVKGFFKRPVMDKEMHIEITEDEHPMLFVFIQQLCDELDAPLPNRVFVSPEVNAAVMPQTSLINLFVEPKKDLLIGLGLVNSVNLSEFKAVLAHEFGHFSQSAMASSYTYVANRIIGDLVEGEDWFDRMVNYCKAQENALAIVGYAIGAPLWVGRKMIEWFYKAITLQRLAVSREREFHADLVAVSAAGSNAVVHCLLRTEFGHQCFMQAVTDLATALDHKLYSNDLYLHQDRAAAIVRQKKKEPELGLPPGLKTPSEGKDVEVFDAEEEEMEDEIPPMWRTHPSNSDREKNAKEEFVAAVVDHRSPWILFDEASELRERMTYKFYRMVFRIPKKADLADAVNVQKFIDNEHAETTYDPKYKGAYDDRPIEPGELNELNGIIRDTPWTEDRMEKVLDKLYEGCEEHAESHSELYKEEQSLRSGIVGRPSPKMKRKLEELKEKQDENWEWFKSFDRRVYLLHVQMAAQVDQATKNELVERYRFQLEVQRLYQESRAAFNKADTYLGAYAAAARGEIQVPPDFPGEVIQVLRESWKTLKNIIKDAKEINLPAMKNFEEGENLAAFILEGKMVPEPPLSYVKGVWIDKLMTQLNAVKNKCFRLHFKSVGGILRMHEEIAEKWRAFREPISAEVVEEEPIVAEVLPEPIEAEVLPELIEAEVIPAEVLPDEPPSEQATEPVTPYVSSYVPLGTSAQSPAPAAPKGMAAFVAPPLLPTSGSDLLPPVLPSITTAASPSSEPAFLSSPLPTPAAEATPPSEPEPVALAPTPSEPEPVAIAPDSPVTEAAPVPESTSAPEPSANTESAKFVVDFPTPTPTSTSAPAPQVAASAIFSLDADDYKSASASAAQTTPIESAAPIEDQELPSTKPDLSASSAEARDLSPAKPGDPDRTVAAPSEPQVEPQPMSVEIPTPQATDSSFSVPALQTTTDSSFTVPAPKLAATAPPSVVPSVVRVAAKGKRPVIKITVVKPGEDSPLAK